MIDNTINGRTPEEIKLWLELCCVGKCSECPYREECDEHLARGGDMLHADVVLTDTTALINQLQEDKKQLECERDELMEDIKLVVGGFPCLACFYSGNKSHMCDDCDVHTFCNWQWRGIQEVKHD